MTTKNRTVCPPNSRTKFYKNCYAIALYDKNEYLFDIVDSVHELCGKYNLNYNSITNSISRIRSNHHHGLTINGTNYSVHFINMNGETL
jgi:hypothetical protein